MRRSAWERCVVRGCVEMRTGSEWDRCVGEIDMRLSWRKEIPNWW